jgi:DNA-binding LacI/PurR family transcriptional regulator
MNRRSVTIKFLAEKANMSFSTVAKALHDDPAINEKTRERIKKIAKEFNYRPNILAKGLRNRKTKFIGMILNDLQSPFYSEIYKAIGDVLNKRGYTMLLADSCHDEELEKKNISTMISQGVEGIIISSVSEESENIRLLLDEHVKVVFIDNHPSDATINCVYVDHEKAARIGTEHLIQEGHSSILLLNGPVKLSSSQHFTEGYRKVLTEHGIPVREEMIKYNQISIGETSTQFDAIFSGEDSIGRDDFTAILAFSDVIAIGVYEAALQHGFSIPGRYSVVGYDNILATKYLNPALTTLHQPKEQTGIYSINLLLDQIEKNRDEHRQIILSPELIIRASVKNLSR